MNDPTSQLLSATRRAKSDVANKLVSMFLHELSPHISQGWPIRVDDEEYGRLVREQFGNLCPYCGCDLATAICVIEHLDGRIAAARAFTLQATSWLLARDAITKSVGTIP